MDPNNARGWTNLGSAYQQTENFNKAREDYQKALTIDPKGEVDNYYYIGILDENAGQVPAAIQDYQSYLQKAGARAQYAVQAQGRISSLRANPGSAQKITTQAETKRSGDAQAAYDAAVKAQGENKFDEAIEDYNKALALSPTDASFVYGMATAYQGKNDMVKALDNYKKAASMNPKEPTYKQGVTQAQQVMAAPLLQSAIDKQTTKNDPTGALADYQAALKLDDEGTTHMNYGTCLQQVNKLAEAVTEYRRGIQMDAKGCVDAHYYLGTCYEGLKKPGEALHEYQEYVRLAPTGANVKESRERIKLLAPAHR